MLAPTAEKTNLLELFQIQAKDGPCLDCYRTGQAISVDNLADNVGRWPTFAPVAIEIGYLAVHTFPMRLRDTTIGALNLFSTVVGPLPADDQHVAQALADIATIGLLQERAIHESGIVVTQLEGALASRVVIEQAKGVLAEQSGLDMETAFQVLRNRARTSNRRLSVVAQEIVERPSLVQELTLSPNDD
ncbi:unannotated protein [freshwater metagenome]|uniref:Unannotated protein n=1 Tax=freshwater metagenome TaxID=449393 RepID=A0A6J6SM14_9ZZZZ